MEGNNPVTGDGNLVPAKRGRGRPPGSKNKPKVDATLNGPKQPEQPKQQGKPVVSKRKAKSSPQSASAVQLDGHNLPEGSIPGTQNIALDPALMQTTPLEGGQATNNLQQDLTKPPQDPPAIPAEEATPNVINCGPPVPTFNLVGQLQPPTTPHRQGCPCMPCFRDRPHEYKTTKSGASFEVFANLVGEATAAIYQRNEEISYMMAAYADLPTAEFRYQQQKLVRESLATDPFHDHQGNPITTAPMPWVVKENVARMATQRIEELTSRNKTFRFLPPCILGLPVVEDAIMGEGEGMGLGEGMDEDEIMGEGEGLGLGEDMDEDADMYGHG